MLVFGEIYEVLRKLGSSRADSAVLLLGDILRNCADLSDITRNLIGQIQFEEKRISDCIDLVDKKIYQIELELLIVIFMACLEEDMKVVEKKYGIDIPEARMLKLGRVF